MTKVSTNDGVVSLEHMLVITEGRARAIKANPKKISQISADLHFDHFLSVTEDGVFESKIGRMVDPDKDLEEEIEALKNDHKALMSVVDDLNGESEEIAVPANSNNFMTTLDSLWDKAHDENFMFFAFAVKNGIGSYRGNIPSTLAALILREYAESK